MTELLLFPTSQIISELEAMSYLDKVGTKIEEK